jgi:hypothetical protein
VVGKIQRDGHLDRAATIASGFFAAAVAPLNWVTMEWPSQCSSITHLLHRGHQGKRQERGPQERQALFGSSLCVGGDARRVVVGRTGNQSGAYGTQIPTPFGSRFRRLHVTVAWRWLLLGPLSHASLPAIVSAVSRTELREATASCSPQ